MIGGVLTWLVLALVLVLFGARAWVVETNRGRLTTAGATQRGLTWAVAASVALLVVMAMVNGGLTLTGLLINGEAETGTPSDSAPVVSQQAPAAPAAPAPAPAPAP
ncbi:hypothetical protein [Pseudonocardia sp. KRD291]|uniref:hypothetical protein n=1 Tax=Pseudonocardia sp. KRD291 TaxID=2792007 RepID=UPI001C49F445|nr:hypothetical protein [Pseudonocardia sp. KRD291]MBW0104210.1 hypothetical protein [Pseudonocardia sp. KRD291]